MPTRDYYLILGVSRNECAEGIREAFRELALKFHPDRAGPGTKSFFQEIIEAYETLSDPTRRASYDRGLQHATRESRGPASGKVRYGTPQSQVPVEPLVPERGRWFKSPRFNSRAFEEVFEGVLGSFMRAPSSRGSVRPLELAVEITEREAWRGGTLSVDVPVFWPCSQCKGAGRRWVGSCENCDDTGLREERRQLRIPIPPGVQDRTVLNVPVRGLGVHNLFVRVYLRVYREAF